jgi:hypothetical protein
MNPIPKRSEGEIFPSPDPNEPYYDPNQPYDPNWVCDPNDPNCPGQNMMMGIGGGMNMAMSATGVARGDSGLTAGELEECIALLTDITWDTQQDADNIAEFILSLQQELDALYEKQAFGLYTQ